MRRWNNRSYELQLILAAAVLAGCGLQSSESNHLLPVGGAERSHSSSGALLYVSSTYHREVDVFSFITRKLVMRLKDLPNAGALCSDANGNIWVGAGESGSWKIIKFAHGEKAAITSLDVPGTAQACSVDPTTGNLAVAHDGTSVTIWPNASGTPTTFIARSMGFILSVAYDDDGTLFAYGTGFQDGTALAELPKSSSSFFYFKIHQFLSPTFAQWSGNNLLVAGCVDRRYKVERVFQLTIQGSSITVSGKTKIVSPKGFVADGVVYGGSLLQAISSGSNVDFYAYPKGGRRQGGLSEPRNTDLDEVAVSAGS